MKTTVISSILLLILTACATNQKVTCTGRARVTVYDPKEVDKIKVRRGHKWCWRKICFGHRTASGARAKQGVTLAAPPWVPFGTKVMIPALVNLLGSGPYVVQDRGAGYRLLHAPAWFDVFVENPATRRKLQYGLPEWMDYRIVQ